MIYDYNTNEIHLKTKYGVEFNLRLRDSITIIDGDSASGKTLLTSTIEEYQTASLGNSYKEADNIFIVNIALNNAEKILEVHNKLIIVDNAKILLTDKLISHINSDTSNRYLILGRGIGGLEASPNHHAVLERQFIGGQYKISLTYRYNVKGWG